MSIAALTRKCSELLSLWLTAAAALPELLNVENNLFRFNLWAENNNALSDGRDSMDWRLRKTSVPHAVMTDLLEVLAATIQRKFPQEAHSWPGSHAVAGKLTSVGKSYDVHPEGDLDTADAILDQLFRFSRAIRRSGIMSRFVKVTNYFEHDEITGENLTAKFQEGVMPYLDRRLPKETDAWLKERLCETICLRQQNFSFLRSLEKAKAIPRVETLPGPKARSRLGSAYSVKSRRTDQTDRPAEPSKRTDSQRQPSIRSATTVETNNLLAFDPIEEEEAAEYTRADLPRRPKPPPVLKCPYCFLVCHVSEFTEEGWPYVVLLPTMYAFRATNSDVVDT